MTDPMLMGVYSSENNRVFFEYNVMLSAIFSVKGYRGVDSYLQMSKATFLELMKDSNLLIYPKPKSKEELKKEEKARADAKAAGKTADLPAADPVFTEVELTNCISSVGSFDPDMLDYYNFLECILRVAQNRPWNDEESKELTSFDLKLDMICGALEEKYFYCIDENEKKRQAFEKERKYQPRIVVDDDEDPVSDDEDL